MLAKKFVCICHYVYLQAYTNKVVIRLSFNKGNFVFLGIYLCWKVHILTSLLNICWQKSYISIGHYVYMQAYNNKVVISLSFNIGKFVFLGIYLCWKVHLLISLLNICWQKSYKSVFVIMFICKLIIIRLWLVLHLCRVSLSFKTSTYGEKCI